MPGQFLIVDPDQLRGRSRVLHSIRYDKRQMVAEEFTSSVQNTGCSGVHVPILFMPGTSAAVTMRTTPSACSAACSPSR